MITERAVNRLAADYKLTADARRLSYLEHAQEHFLKWMDQEELFDLGTALRMIATMPDRHGFRAWPQSLVLEHVLVT